MERTALPEGTELGGYVLGPVLGSGGMGTVYRALDADGVTVALKLLHPALWADPAARRRLRREVAVLQRLRFGGIAQVMDAELDGPEAFVVTEYIHGQTLAQSVAGDGPYAPDELANLADHLVASLALIHRAGVIHRDLKPGNIMIGPAGPVLIDFGIAQESEATRLTGTGFVIGTPGFVAPELIVGGQPTPAADEWGLAAVLAFAATGRPPFGEGRFDVVFSRVSAGQADLGGLARSIADPLAAALRPEPGDRLSAADLAAALRAAAAGTEWVGPTRALEAPNSADDDGPSDFPDAYPGGYSAGGYPDDVFTDGGYSGGGGGGLPPAGPAAAYSRPDLDPYGRPLAGAGPEADWPLPARPPVPRRRALAVSLWLALTAMATLAPLVGGVIVGGIVWLGRTVAVGSESLRLRRERRGPRTGDGLRTVAATPIYAVRAVVELIPALLVGAALGAATWAALHYGTTAADTLALGAGVGVATLGVWWGPTAAPTRFGTLRLLGAVTARGWLAFLLGAAALAWAALVTAGWATGAAEGPLGWIWS